MDGSVVSQDSAQFAAAQNDSGACAGLGAETMFASPRLDAGPHSMLLTVVAASDKEFGFFGGMLTLGVNTQGHDVSDSNVVDDQDLGWTLSGGRAATGGTWHTAVDPILSEKTGTFQCNYGSSSTASYNFSGAGGLILHGIVGGSNHAFSVSLDGTTVNMDATTSWKSSRAILFVQGDLDPSSVHTLTVMDYSSDDTGCIDGADGNSRVCCVGIDSLLLLEAGTKTLPTPSTPSSSNSTVNTETPKPRSDTLNVTSSKSVVGRVIGGVIGGLALATLVIALLFHRRRKQMLAANLVSAFADSTQCVAHPQVADTGSRMGYNTGQSSGTAALLASSNASPTSIPGSGREVTRVGGSADKWLLLSREKRPMTESTPTGSVGRTSLAPADLERVLAFVAERMDQYRPAAEVQQHDERPPQYGGSMRI